MIKILMLVQLPPPLHGAAVVNERVHNLLTRSFSCQTIVLKLNYAKTFEEMHNSTFQKCLYILTLLKRALITYFKERPHSTYIALAPFGPGFYRDVLLVSLARIFRSQPHLHIHGTGLVATRNRLKITLLRWIFNQSKIIVIAESLKQDILPFATDANIFTIPNCVDDPGYSRRVLGEKIQILYLANLDERKGVKSAIDIFCKLIEAGYNAQLTIAGADTALLTRNTLKIYISENYASLESHINLIGPVYGKRKTDCFNRSDIFLYPTRHDAAPLVVIEALSHGLPVICSAQGALPDIVKNGMNGFTITDYSIKNYISAFSRCVDSYTRLTHGARQSFLSNFTSYEFESRVKQLLLIN